MSGQFQDDQDLRRREKMIGTRPSSPGVQRAASYVLCLAGGLVLGVVVVGLACASSVSLFGLMAGLVLGCTVGAILIRRCVPSATVLGFVLGALLAEIGCLAITLVVEFLDRGFRGYVP